MVSLNVITPSAVTLMIKPVGALCNLDCHYCYYLPTQGLYDGPEHRMKLETLESIFAGFLPGAADEVTICWQGGEPTLAGLEFFNKAIEFQKKYSRPGQMVSNALQTNGTLLNDDWCRFFKKHGFLVGISIDGPASCHDHYRWDKKHDGSYANVQRGLRLLQRHHVEYNVLCVLNDHNVHHPDDVFRNLINAGSRWVQFIPAIEWLDEGIDTQRLADFSPSAKPYGKFMCRVFDLWFEKHRQRISVRLFDAMLSKLVLNQMPYCIFDGSCHGQVTIEHNGDVFGCDHFVDRRWQLGHIGDAGWQNRLDFAGDARAELTVGGADEVDEPTIPAKEGGRLDTAWLDRLESERLGAFGERKLNLPDSCKSCEYLPLCHGGCPKHRPQRGDAVAHTVLCEGYQMLYAHTLPRLNWLGEYLRRGMQPPAPGAERQPQQRRAPGPHPGTQKVGRNAPCPCGSGLKFKMCCGRR